MKGKGAARISVTDAFSCVAIWQVMAFVFLMCFVWVNELFDLASIMFGATPTPFNFYRLCLLSAGIITTAVVAVGHSYEKQRTIVKEILEACLYCHRVRIVSGDWEHVEEYFTKHYPIAMNRGVCPDCKTMLTDLDKHVAEKKG